MSRTAGYRPNGPARMPRRDGKPAELRRPRLVPADLVRDEHPIVVTGLSAFRRAVVLDPAPAPTR